MDFGRPKPLELAGENATKAPRSTTVDVAKLLAKFKQENVQGVILDLRANGGGVLEEAIKLTGLFIRKGPVVQASDWDGTGQIYGDDDPTVAYDGPLIVLTSRYSASASEIVAGALQDYGRAIIVGDSSTHGKGTVQTVQDLDSLRVFMRLADSGKQNVSPGAVKITIRKFYRVSGASTQLKGVIPDIVLPSLRNYARDIGESALENPLPWDTIKAARYEGDMLEIQQSALATPSRIQAEAVGSMGMAPATEVTYLRLEQGASGQTQVAEAVTVTAAATPAVTAAGTVGMVTSRKVSRRAPRGCRRPSGHRPFPER